MPLIFLRRVLISLFSSSSCDFKLNLLLPDIHHYQHLYKRYFFLRLYVFSERNAGKTFPSKYTLVWLVFTVHHILDTADKNPHETRLSIRTCNDTKKKISPRDYYKFIFFSFEDQLGRAAQGSYPELFSVPVLTKSSARAATCSKSASPNERTGNPS